MRFYEWVSTGAWTEQSSSSSPLLKEIPSLRSSTLSDDLINGQEGMCEKFERIMAGRCSYHESLSELRFSVARTCQCPK